MKKVLFVLGIVAATSFAACNSTKDCACDLVDLADGNVVMRASDAEGDLDVLEFDGDCADITWTEYSGPYKTEELMQTTKPRCAEK